jgi:hypothetical protein
MALLESQALGTIVAQYFPPRLTFSVGCARCLLFHARIHEYRNGARKRKTLYLMTFCMIVDLPQFRLRPLLVPPRHVFRQIPKVWTIITTAMMSLALINLPYRQISLSLMMTFIIIRKKRSPMAIIMKMTDMVVETLRCKIYVSPLLILFSTDTRLQKLAGRASHTS